MEEESIFANAIEMGSPVERDSYLDEACAGDDELRARLERLIEAHLEPDPCLDTPPDDLLATAAAQLVKESVGSTIGPYRLLELIGEGGMGLVFMAQQQRPLRRLVALKIIKPGMDTRQIVLRFEAERQTLALMDHPHIAKILDSGTTDSGRPYFVMELVRGIAVTDYCDQAGLNPRQRLELFLNICQAVQHAHQHGIIHRDLKPANILVTMHDDVAVAKVIDFGVAKALHRRLIEQTLFTNFAQLIGTPVYMSPEQAQMSGLDVDTRSDVYSLGVLLYELLTGTTPFDRDRLREVGCDEMRRIIREEDPPAMSSRLSTLAAEKLSTVSQRRGTDARRLASILRGELDWIVMKALEKNRERRYESASALAADVQRYLDDQPVEAHPPSRTYRVRKFARRNRTLLTTSFLVGLAMVAGTAASIWQAFEATRARDLADERLENEKQARADADEQRQRASENLQQALDAVDQMLTRVADERLAAIAGAESVRRELFQDALRFYQEFFRRAPDNPQLRTSTAKAWSRVAELHDFFGDPATAQDARQESINRWETLHAEDPGNPETQASLAAINLAFGHCEHWRRYRHATATAKIETARSLFQDLAHRFSDNLYYQWEMATAEFVLADIHKCMNRPDQAERAYRRALNAQRQLCGRETTSGWHASLCQSLTFLANFLATHKKGDDEIDRLYEEAVRQGEEVLASDPQSTFAAATLVSSLQLFADRLSGSGKVAEAETHYRRAVQVGQLLTGDNSRDVFSACPLPRAQVALANLLAGDGRGLEALALYRAAGDMLRPVMFFPVQNSVAGAVRWQADQGLLNTLNQVARAGQLDEARSFCELISQTRGSGSVEIASQFLAAEAWQRIGDAGRSRSLVDEAVRRMERANPADQSQLKLQIAKFQNGLAWSLVTNPAPERRDIAAALASACRATELQPNIGSHWNTLGIALYRNGDLAESIEALGKSLQYEKGDHSWNYFFLAMAHWRSGQKEEAQKWHRQAVVWMDKNKPADEELLRFRAEAEELLELKDVAVATSAVADE